eukprot:TRINITY_DN7400_c0_g1_i1.p1 TRINITY_DN7400_c0_g1~~TRINITY_DN7400_c0_g1_i1.p1  ORF type:complete len:409 (+),score=77.29 TRINITY_DN7400_c0_g1_i1:33-1229(+)
MDTDLEEQLKKQYAAQKKILKDTINDILSDIKQVQDDYQSKLGKMRQSLIQERSCLNKELSIQDNNRDTVAEINAFKESERIGIVVNGVRYVVTRQNIEKVNSILKVMISGKYSNRMDDEGNYVFDYDGDSTFFHLIFNYIRSGGEFNVPLSYIHSNMKDIIKASRFFCLKDLTSTLVSYAVYSDPGENVNVLQSAVRSGDTTILHYSAEGGASIYGSSYINGNEDSSYYANGCLIDYGSEDLPERRSRSYRTITDTGSFWYSNGEESRGVLVIDLSKTNFPRRISTFQFYQSSSTGGKCTHIRFSRYPSFTSKPAIADTNWEKVHEEEWLELSDCVTGSHDGNNYVELSDEFNLEPFFTKYIKVECRNDGRYGPTNIHLRQLKAFGRNVGENNEQMI